MCITENEFLLLRKEIEQLLLTGIILDDGKSYHWFIKQEDRFVIIGLKPFNNEEYKEYDYSLMPLRVINKLGDFLDKGNEIYISHIWSDVNQFSTDYIILLKEKEGINNELYV